ncbi:MAG: UDP-N-acetylmuramate dehydrogenase [Candidatus Parcubacteria bacterium]|jgi:UDP-N-acetylmuramate dehydrogenase
MNDFLEELQVVLPALEVKRGAEIASLTAFRTGGSAGCLLSVDTSEVLIKVVSLAWKHDIQVRVIGSGTNILVSEDGFDGLVIKNNCRKFDLQGMKGKFMNQQMKLTQAYLYAESGAIMNQVVRFVIDQGFGGIEFALGLPGTIGGAVCVNANFPKENIRIGRAVYAAKILTKDQGVIDVENNYFRFGEDSSRLLSDRSVLISVLFALYPEDKKKLWERAEQAVTYRTTTQPKMLMTGMTFRNMTLKNLYPNSSLSSDVTPELLLEKAGLLGLRVGDVELWDKNPRYIINKGKGTLSDVEILQSRLRETLFRQFGVQLEITLHGL